MKFISVRDLRGKSAEVWKELPAEREVVVTSLDFHGAQMFNAQQLHSEG